MEDSQKIESHLDLECLIFNRWDPAEYGFFCCAYDGRILWISDNISDDLGINLEGINDECYPFEGEEFDRFLKLIREDFDFDEEKKFAFTLPFHNAESVYFNFVSKIKLSTEYFSEKSVLLVFETNYEDDPFVEDKVALNFDFEAVFSKLLNNVPFPVVQVDINSRILLGNRVFIDKIDEVDSHNIDKSEFSSFLMQKDRLKFLEAITEVIDEEDSQSLDVEYMPELGNQTVTILIVPTKIVVEGYENVLLFIIEPTLYGSIEAQVAQSQKMQAIGQLAGGIAHDFNNVLTAIIGAVDLLLASHQNTDPSFQDIMSIKNNANRASGLVRQLLAFSRRQTLIPTEIIVNDQLSDLVHLLLSLLGENIDFRITSGENMWTVMADPTQFDQVLINLAINARDAMPNGGKLTIHAENVPQNALKKFVDTDDLESGDYVLLDVTDTGIGMSEKLTEKIFEPFFTTKEVGEGTGLGLSTVYGIVEQSGGYIFAESNEGQGTSFKIFLPRFMPETKKTSSESVQISTTNTDLTGSATLLLVEDDESVRYFAKRGLISRGYSVLEASSGAEALNIINNNELNIDLIVSDVVMPEIDGPTLLTEVRKTKPDTKIIFISGYAKDAFEGKLEGDEEFQFLAKPFTLKDLSATVKKTLNST